MSVIAALREALGAQSVLTGADTAPYSHDWMRLYHWTPLCVVRPANTDEVAKTLQIAHQASVPVVPVSGNTGLAGGTKADGAVMLSLERLNKIRQIRPEARLAVVEAGVILSQLHDAVLAQNLSFPMTFGARGSARIGGILATNAGGSNVLRYGNTRDLVLGVEAVLADGTIVDLMSALHKDNSGYSLKHLLIGSEGTLGVITAAVLKLVPKPQAYATALVAVEDMRAALTLLNRLQQETGGAVEAFEYMSPAHLEGYAALHPEKPSPLAAADAVTLLVEVAATAPHDAQEGADGQTPLAQTFQDILSDLLENGLLHDAVLAQSDSQRGAMWAMREAAAEVVASRPPLVNHDIAVPLDYVGTFLERMDARLATLDPAARSCVVAHLGDGNIHYPVWLSSDDAAAADKITEAVEDEVERLGGSFSAEHGIGLSKKPSMKRRKNPQALAAMHAIKSALDPSGVLNPGKVLPD